MERSPIGLEQYVQSLETLKIENGVNGAIVMNANPFTLGHQYLAEYAAADCDHLFIWVVEEDASAFPYEDRIELVRQGTSHLENVVLLVASTRFRERLFRVISASLNRLGLNGMLS